MQNLYTAKDFTHDAGHDTYQCPAGKAKMNLVWTLHCLVHNLGKLVVNAPGCIAKLAGENVARA